MKVWWFWCYFLVLMVLIMLFFFKKYLFLFKKNNAFFKDNWYFLKHEIRIMLDQFHGSKRLPQSLLSYFVTLIPNVKSSTSLRIIQYHCLVVCISYSQRFWLQVCQRWWILLFQPLNQFFLKVHIRWMGWW